VQQKALSPLPENKGLVSNRSFVNWSFLESFRQLRHDWSGSGSPAQARPVRALGPHQGMAALPAQAFHWGSKRLSPETAEDHHFVNILGRGERRPNRR
jgi:hypothetical protein